MMLKNLLLYRLGIYNFLCGTFLTWAGFNGWLLHIWENDASKISAVIAAVFLLILGSTFIQGWKLTKDKNAVKEGRLFQPLGAKRLHKLDHIYFSEGLMFTLGLIGTVVGFIVAFQGVDPGATSDAAGVEGLMHQLVQGVSVALYTTLVGAVTAVWTGVNYLMLRTAAKIVIEDEKNASL